MTDSESNHTDDAPVEGTKESMGDAIACPSCGSTEDLCRVETVIAKAFIQPSDVDEKGWEYSGESKILWDTQGRDRHTNDIDLMYEFECTHCDTPFDWCPRSQMLESELNELVHHIADVLQLYVKGPVDRLGLNTKVSSLLQDYDIQTKED